jgi:hypothetical protein
MMAACVWAMNHPTCLLNIRLVHAGRSPRLASERMLVSVQDAGRLGYACMCTTCPYPRVVNQMSDFEQKQATSNDHASAALDKVDCGLLPLQMILN